MTEETRVDITRYVRRAVRLQDRHGGYEVRQLLSAADLAALERAAAVLLALTALNEAIPAVERERLVQASLACNLTARALRAPALNWPEEEVE